MKVVYACYGKAGLDGLYQLLNRPEISPAGIFAVTYADRDNQQLVRHLESLMIDYTTRPINVQDTRERIGKFSPDFLFSIYFRDIIPSEVLDSIKHASVNLHPSLLPQYKGCFSIPWVLIRGEKKTGITYHLIDPGVDTGNIVIQEETEIRPWDTAFSLYHRLVSLGMQNFNDMFQQVVVDGRRGKSQPLEGETFKRQIPYDGYISLTWSKNRISDFIRAMYFPPFEGAKLKYRDKDYEFRNMNQFENFIETKGIKLK